MGVVNCHVVEYPSEIDVLLREGLDQVMELHAGYRQHRRLIEFGVIEARQQMRAAGSGCGQTHAQRAGPFRISACHEGGGFLMPYLHEVDFVPLLAERFHHSVYAVAGEAEHHPHVPGDQRIDQDFRCVRHGSNSFTVRTSMRRICSADKSGWRTNMGSCGTLGGSPLAAVERSEINVSRGHMGVCLSSSAGFATICALAGSNVPWRAMAAAAGSGVS